MKNPTPVIVGTDGSPCADRAVEWAAAEAVRRRRPLHVVTAVRPWDYDARLPLASASEPLSDAGRQVLGQAVELARKTAPEIEITTELVFDAPAFALRSRAEHAFEVVIGNRGHGGFTGLLLGSTGLKVAGHVPGPVIVVRGETDGEKREVLVGVDPADESGQALEYAFETAPLRGSWVRAVYVWHELTMYESAAFIPIQEAVAAAQERLASAVAPFRKRFPGIRVIEEALPGQIVERLVERSHRADLAVVGAHRCGPGRHFGDVSHGLIHHAACPVAVVGRHA